MRGLGSRFALAGLALALAGIWLVIALGSGAEQRAAPVPRSPPSPAREPAEGQASPVARGPGASGPEGERPARSPVGPPPALRPVVATRELAGRVLERRGGRPIAGARVLGGPQAEHATQSAADGGFRLALPLAGEVGSGFAPGTRLEARHPDYVDLCRPLAEGDLARPIEVRLERSAILSVTVRGEGSGRAGRTLFVAPDLPDVEPLALPIGPDDRVRVADLAPGAYRVAAQGAAGPPALEPLVYLEAGGETQLVLDLSAGWAFEGTVLATPGGAPVGGARVVLAGKGLDPLGRESAALETASAGDGTFRLEGCPGGDARLAVTAPWGAEVELDVVVREDGREPVTVSVPGSAALAGRVVDERGRASAGAVVLWSAGGPGPVSAGAPAPEDGGRAVADAEGRFEFPALPSGRKLALVAFAGGCSARESLSLLAGERRADLVLALPAALAIGGRVLRAGSRAPVAGAGLTLRSAQRSYAALAVESDAEGTFEARLPAGPATIEVRAEGLARKVLSVSVDGRSAALEIELEEQAALEGWMLDEAGWGIPHARLRLDSEGGGRSTRADELGRYRIEDVDPGSYAAVVRAPGFETLREGVALAAGTQVRDFTLEATPLAPPGEVRGEIVLRGSGEPVDGLSFSGARGARATRNGAEFRLVGVAPGPLRLRIQAPGVEGLALDEVQVAPGGRVDLGRFETRRTARVEVRLEGGSARGPVYLSRVDPPALPALVVPERVRLVWDGRRRAFVADGVGRYTWTLTVLDGKRIRLRQPLVVRDGLTEVTVELTPGGER